jgi:hypothetical protein
LRKSLIAAGAATLAIGGAGIAYAQTAAPTIVVNPTVSPSKAGTKKKPKASKLVLQVTNNVDQSKATASSIKITLPSTLKLSTKGLPQCKVSDDTLVNEGPAKACKKSIAGSGTSHAILNPYNAPATITFQVTPLVGHNQMLYYLNAPGVTKAVLHGRISGHSQTIAITPELQQPVPGVFSAIVDLKTTISLRKGKKSLFTSTGCTGGAHKITVTETFVPNPTQPASNSATATGVAPCRK